MGPDRPSTSAGLADSLSGEDQPPTYRDNALASQRFPASRCPTGKEQRREGRPRRLSAIIAGHLPIGPASASMRATAAMSS